MPRKGFLAAAVPVMLQGVGGPGAPHQFEFTRREMFGISPAIIASFFGGWKSETGFTSL